MQNTIRQSNFELLRLLAMFLVLLLHANNTLSVNVHSEICIDRPVYSFFVYFICAIATVGVNVFVLISGWFSIQPKLKGLLNIIFQTLFYSFGIFFICIVFGIGDPFNLKNLASLFLFTKSYWFIKSYIGLYIMAPVLNAFVEKATKTQMIVFLSAFYVLQSIWGFTDAAADYNFGLSFLSFCGLYILGRFIHLYSPGFSQKKKIIDISIFFTVCAILAIVAYYCYRVDASRFITRCIFSYINPLIVISAVALLLLFSKLSINSKIINFAATSCFSIYLIHENVNLQWYYRNTAHTLISGPSLALSLLKTIGFILAVFAVSIIIDQTRKFVWNKISNKIPEIRFDNLDNYLHHDS